MKMGCLATFSPEKALVITDSLSRADRVSDLTACEGMRSLVDKW